MVTKPEELLGRRVRIYLVTTRAEVRMGSGLVEGVVERHEIYGVVVPSSDKRLPFIIDKNRVLDVLDGTYNHWVPVFNGRVPREPIEKKPVKARCSHCGEVGHNRLKCKRRK